MVEQAIGVPFGWDEALALGASGDGWLGARVELAWCSGDALGARLAADFARRP